MPPKKKDGPSKKTEMKKKEKVIEDKTFGLKNKKGTKQQKFIQTVVKQVQHGGQSARKLELLEKDKKKDDKLKEATEMAQLFKPVEQKVGKGVDPKSVVCAFFKQGLCKKGEKCKFSHDLNVGRKAEKRNMYSDSKENEDGMETWDEAKLEDVINKKHGEKNKTLPPTNIICKFFLDAVENNKYGWFWECPGGTNCHYRHALPQGFVLKKDKKTVDKDDQITLEELIEKERAALSSANMTKVTLESFLKWKERKKREKISKATEESNKKKMDYAAGRVVGISGRLMFEFNPDLIEGDDDEADNTVYRRESDDEDEGEERVTEIDFSTVSSMATESDGSGSARLAAPLNAMADQNGSAGDTGEESGKLDMAGALPPQEAGDEGELLADDIPIDENLFDGDDVDDLDEELELLELDD